MVVCDKVAGVKIQVDPHTLKRAQERGTTRDEILDVIRNGFEIPAKFDRKGKAKIYDYGRERQGKTYPQKRVEVFYLIEDNQVVTVTVYVFYGTWEEQ